MIADWKNKSIEEIKDEIKSISHNYQLKAYFIDEEFLLLRGTIINDALPLSITRLSYPPPHYVTRHNRANRKESTLFYAASGIQTVISELHPKKGDLVYLSYWWVKKPILVLPVGFTEDVLKRLGSNLNPRTFIKDEDFFEKFAKHPLTEYFFEAFTKEDISQADIDYKLSIAIAEHFFTPMILDSKMKNDIFLNKYTDEEGRLSKVLDSLIYPSLQNSGNGYNFAMRSECVDSAVGLCRVDCFMIGDSAEEMKLIRFSNPPFLNDFKWHETNFYVPWTINSGNGQILIFTHESKLLAYQSKDGISLDISKAKSI